MSDPGPARGGVLSSWKDCHCGHARGEHQSLYYKCERAGCECDAYQKFVTVVMTPVPNQPKTPTRTFRISDDIYEAAQKRAAEKGETVTDVVVRALKRYGKGA